MSKNLPPRVTTMGKVSLRAGGARLSAGFNPWAGSPQNTDPVEKELSRLKVYPGKTSGSIKIEGENIKATTMLKADLDKAVGSAIMDELRMEMRHPAYRKLSDEDKRQDLTEIIQEARRDARADFIDANESRIFKVEDMNP